jgi:hypothetical protein
MREGWEEARELFRRLLRLSLRLRVFASGFVVCTGRWSNERTGRDHRR